TLFQDSSCRTAKQRLRRVLHWGPLIALFIIFYIAIYTSRLLLIWWPPLKSHSNLLHVAVYALEYYLVMSTYLKAMFWGPGFVPIGWRPIDLTDDQQLKSLLQWCSICKGYKAPRSHHCSRCGRCVTKMDHHCPWINACVGHRNHAQFTYFLLFAPLGCLHSAVIVSYCVYYTLFYPFYHQDSEFPTEDYAMMNLWEVLLAFFCLGLALGTTIAVGALFFVQLKSILRNRTGIEFWICDKADYRLECRHDSMTAHLSIDEAGQPPKFQYPYDLGRMRNFKQVINWSGRPVGNGLDDWPLAPDCGKYDLTKEQVLQKAHKASTAVLASVIRAYTGTRFPISFGLRTACCQPCSIWIEEKRLSLSPGQRLIVTRAHGEWLYGQLLLADEQSQSARDASASRGWFPKKCAMEHWIDSAAATAGDNGGNGLVKDKKVQ
uniref:Palmitoyltransferase n=1 Tax=Macrostomum lignano TaxID=282301 RepID=A0A1I8GWC5_9PLAT